MIQTFLSGGINWTWYLECEVDTSTNECTIVAHYRKHYTQCQPESVGFFYIGESTDGNRIALVVNLTPEDTMITKTYIVKNPKCVFAYEDKE